MKISKFSDQQIAFILRQAEEGTRVEEVCRKAGISQQMCYRFHPHSHAFLPRSNNASRESTIEFLHSFYTLRDSGRPGAIVHPPPRNREANSACALFIKALPR